MISLKTIMGSLAVALSIFSLLPYIADILKRKTKPHLYTWIVWTPLTFIAFFAQISDNAGPGAWTTGVTAILSLVILALAITQGTKNITRIDNLSLIGAGLASILWFAVKDVTPSLILATLVNVAGFIPTIRKSIDYPTEETLITHELSGVKHFTSLFALERFSLITALYPATIVLANVVLVSVIIWNKKRLIPK